MIGVLSFAKMYEVNFTLIPARARARVCVARFYVQRWLHVKPTLAVDSGRVFASSIIVRLCEKQVPRLVQRVHLVPSQYDMTSRERILRQRHAQQHTLNALFIHTRTFLSFF